MRAALLALLIAAGAVPFAARMGWAQSTDHPTVTLAPPHGAQAGPYLRAMRWQNVSARALYATEFDPESFSAPAPRQNRLDLGAASVAVLLLVLVGLLLVWLRFGGTGAMLSRAPKDADGALPEHWNIPQPAQAGPALDLLSELRAMPDRGAALLRLLRHALLAAAQSSDMRFARSDTERDAFARLPATWPHHQELHRLLRLAELSHYGGRPVEEGDFDTTLTRWSEILRDKRHV